MHKFNLDCSKEFLTLEIRVGFKVKEVKTVLKLIEQHPDSILINYPDGKNGYEIRA